MDEIFISYSRHNSGFVDMLINELEKHGFSIWVDREDIHGGTAWREEIAEGIRDCKAFIVVLSEKSVMSDNVAKELALADKHKKIIIPICHQACEIPVKMEYQLAGLQIIDFSEQPFQIGFEQLLLALPSVLTSAAKKPTEMPAKTRMPIRRVNMKWAGILGIASLIVIGIILLAQRSASLFEQEKDLSGLYSIDGLDLDCLEYGGEATISRSGNKYSIDGMTWWVNGTLRSRGSGFGRLNGNVFTITWEGNAGVTNYSVKEDGSFSIKWVHASSACVPGETWTPQ